MSLTNHAENSTKMMFQKKEYSTTMTRNTEKQLPAKTVGPME